MHPSCYPIYSTSRRCRQGDAGKTTSMSGMYLPVAPTRLCHAAACTAGNIASTAHARPHVTGAEARLQSSAARAPSLTLTPLAAEHKPFSQSMYAARRNYMCKQYGRLVDRPAAPSALPHSSAKACGPCVYAAHPILCPDRIGDWFPRDLPHSWAEAQTLECPDSILTPLAGPLEAAGRGASAFQAC